MSERTARRKRLGSMVGVAALIGLLAAGCGSAEENQNDQGSEGTVERGVAQTDVTIAATGEPQSGGTVRYGLEAETDGWDPTKNRWAISGMMVGLAVYDPLTAMDAEAEPQPYLAQSLEPNADYTEWTITLRDGVTFHDGTPLTGEAVKATLDAHKASLLTGSAVIPVESVAFDPATPLQAVVTMNQPWVAFPAAMTAQIGFIVSPATLADPNGSRDPIGTGPFDFQEWVPDARTVTTKNADYWQEGLPYLDGVEFVPFKEAQGRANALEGGEIDMMHTSNPETILSFRQKAAAGELQIVEDRGSGEEAFVMLNTESPPLDDVRVRKAIALATDSASYTQIVDGGVPEVARGPFKADSPWYAETAYPAFDEAAATALIAEVEAEKGPVAFSLGTTPSPENQEAVQTLAQMWTKAGMEVEIKTVDQTSFISEALQGNYQANLWRQFGAVDPDTDSVWWFSNDDDPATLNLNFARNSDPVLDEALLEGRSNPDDAARRAAYATLQERLAEDIPYVWLNHTIWAIVANNQVRGITNGPLPDGEPSLPTGGTGTFGGTHRLTQTWLNR